MIYIENAEEVRRLLPSPLHKNGTQVQQRRVCPLCGGTRRVQVNRTGLVGDFQQKRCWVCKRGKK